MNKRSSGKTVITLLLLVPLAFIIYFAVTYASNRLDPSSVSSISVTFSRDGREIKLTEAGDIEFFTNAVADAVEIASPLRDLEKSDKVTLIFDRGDKLLEYILYPELSFTGCMLDKKDGKLYALDNDTAKQLLSRGEFFYLYEKRFAKPLIISSGSTKTPVMPSVYEWHYKLVSGDFVEYTDCEIYDGTTVFSLYADRENDFEFEEKPDSITVELTDSEGIPLDEADVGALMFTRDTLINVKVNAVWSHDSQSEFYGNATYSFRMLYDVPSTVTLGSDTVTAGGAISVNVSHLNENQTVTVESDIKLSPMVFSENQGLKTAMLAIDPDTPEGIYDLKFKIGDTVIEKTLTVTPIVRDFYRLTISSETYNKLLGEVPTQELEQLIATLNSKISATAYGNPDAPMSSVAGEFKLETAFGTEILMNLDGDTDTRTHYAIGNTYECVEGSKVYAAKTGKVVFSGLTLTLGNTVVIDHGCGLMTWYYGLKSIERNVGDVVNAGDVVGFAGNSDYKAAPRICFAVSVCGKFTAVQ